MMGKKKNEPIPDGQRPAPGGGTASDDVAYAQYLASWRKRAAASSENLRSLMAPDTEGDGNR
eukprot:CAMPEP_0174842026 /NCGR_PEP_ID=MMETSP1114-20130205/9667_1 /TAXON_ID=312471 /ORGANISM="Neobodo designis, Strain CCAP 1951/1" /LENGTH=61 /DNA_ID=CAMNT_0016076223 /DNA_START=167 /DNA_END=348 /DNA_ORIENTATION=+